MRFIRLSTFLTILIFNFAAFNCVFADPETLLGDQKEGYLERDVLIKDQINIYDNNGEKRVFIKPDRLNRARNNIFDKNSNIEGYIDRDPLRMERKNIYNNTGELEGYTKPDILNKGRTNIYDKNGRMKGQLIVQNQCIFH